LRYLLVAVPPVTVTPTTTSLSRMAVLGSMLTITGRDIVCVPPWLSATASSPVGRFVVTKLNWIAAYVRVRVQERNSSTYTVTVEFEVTMHRNIYMSTL